MKTVTVLRIGALAISLNGTVALAQSSSATGVAVDAQTGILPTPGNQVALSKLTKDVYGHPCIRILAEARPLINNLFSHVVIASNGCPTAIKISACYPSSHDCVAASVPPRGRKELLLGNFPGAKNFRFEFRETN